MESLSSLLSNDIYAKNQLVLGHDHINTWDEMKRVMRRRFVPSIYQRDLRNRLQTLKQGSNQLMIIIRRWSYSWFTLELERMLIFLTQILGREPVPSFLQT